ncbi:MAG: hypothetical protein J2P37_33875, partial [Ktedonobacteraceae bacterium]|nr:hypothetical protein [Ktedonobacteraceae bacterium]
MNLWIIGALMAIGLLSIIGLVTMVMEEQKSKRAPRGEPARWTDTEETMAVAPAPEEARLQRIGGQIRELTDQMD